jgi:hypothetical protein
MSEAAVPDWARSREEWQALSAWPDCWPDVSTRKKKKKKKKGSSCIYIYIQCLLTTGHPGLLFIQDLAVQLLYAFYITCPLLEQCRPGWPCIFLLDFRPFSIFYFFPPANQLVNGFVAHIL